VGNAFAKRERSTGTVECAAVSEVISSSSTGVEASERDSGSTITSSKLRTAVSFLAVKPSSRASWRHRSTLRGRSTICIFEPRTIWSLSNAFTSAFKELDSIPQFKATAKLGEFLEARFSQAF